MNNTGDLAFSGAGTIVGAISTAALDGVVEALSLACTLCMALVTLVRGITALVVLIQKKRGTRK